MINQWLTHVCLVRSIKKLLGHSWRQQLPVASVCKQEPRSFTCHPRPRRNWKPTKVQQLTSLASTQTTGQHMQLIRKQCPVLPAATSQSFFQREDTWNQPTHPTSEQFDMPPPGGAHFITVSQRLPLGVCSETVGPHQKETLQRGTPCGTYGEHRGTKQTVENRYFTKKIWISWKNGGKNISRCFVEVPSRYISCLWPFFYEHIKMSPLSPLALSEHRGNHGIPRNSHFHGENDDNPW